MVTGARPSWHDYFLDLAALVSRRSTCPKLHVGAILVRGNRLLATGYNGAPKGLPHCEKIGCALDGAGHCIAGGTIISKFQTGYYNTGHRTIAEIWEKWQHPQKRGAIRRMSIRSVNPQGMIVPDRIVDVWRSEPKPLYRVTTRLGRAVTTTSDHRFLVPAGWASLAELAVGDLVGLNGRALADDPDWLRQQYVVLGHTQVDIAALAGVDRKMIRRRLDAFGIARRPFSFGGWNRGLRREPRSAYRGPAATAGAAAQRGRRYALTARCAVCGTTDALQVHHVDRDPWNDAATNLMTLCVGCHALAHTPHAKRERVVYDAITKIEAVGEQPVYDLTTAQQHSFIGNGFALHNCIRTIHAETNAILQAREPLEGTTLYSTAVPCWECSKVIIQVGIGEVYCSSAYLDERIRRVGYEWDHPLMAANVWVRVREMNEQGQSQFPIVNLQSLSASKGS